MKGGYHRCEHIWMIIMAGDFILQEYARKIENSKLYQDIPDVLPILTADD